MMPEDIERSRVDRLMSALTLDEKISLLSGQNFWETASISRLQIPSVKMTDGANGARGEALKDGVTAACFPACTALAACWDGTMAFQMGEALGQETKTKGAHVLLGPTLCPHRSPLGGRNFESFSEDPMLAGTMATDYIKGLQSTGVAATVKHYAVNEQETRRFTMDCIVSERAMREIYLKPFEIAVKVAKPWAVMTSYNLVNGVHADQNKFLLQHVLRDQWAFEGLTMSDWGGTSSTGPSISAGLDLEMPGPPAKRKIDAVKAALKGGEIDELAIDRSAKRVLELLELTGKFERPEIDPEQAVDLPEHRALIRQIGAEAIVLLKNSENILPLSPKRVKSIAALGFAKECLAYGGGSAVVNCHYRVTPLQALEARLGEDYDLRYSLGAHTFRVLPDMSVEMADSKGNPGFTVYLHKSKDPASDPFEIYNVPNSNILPFGKGSQLVVLEGTYQPTVSGNHYLSFNGLGPCKLFIDGKVILEITSNCPDSMAFFLGGAEEQVCQYRFEQGRSYMIRVESYAPTEDDPDNLAMINGMPGIRLGFMTQGLYEEDLLQDAVKTAASVECAIIFVGRTSAWETEGRDMPSMSLPASGSQDRLIDEVCKVNKNVIIVNSTGTAIEMPWLNKVSAVIQSWFGGQESGNSIVDVLFGDKNPAGKLPFTIPKTIQDTPSYGNFPGDIEKLKVKYEEGIYIGYRFFDKHPERVQFPFGFGLSYTSFDINFVSLSEKVLRSNTVNSVAIKVHNTGTRTGSEVVQVYVSAPGNSIDVPTKQLAGYQKVELEAGETKVLNVSFGWESAAYWEQEKGKWIVESGKYKVLVGNSAAHVKKVAEFLVESTFFLDP